MGVGTPIKKSLKFAIAGGLVVVAVLSIAFFTMRANRCADIAAGQMAASGFIPVQLTCTGASVYRQRAR